MLIRFIIRASFLVFLVYSGHLLTQSIVGALDFELTPANEPMVHRFIMLAMISYVILMALPFVPGAEIGLVAMVMLGPKIAPLIYGCTVLSLTLSFFIGRYIPESVLVSCAHTLHLSKASALLQDIQGKDTSQRLNAIAGNSGSRFLSGLIGFRYFGLILAINTPGNILIGGGGGLSMVAGMSRLFRPSLFVISVMIAVAPVPLLLLIYGDQFIQYIS